jgi:hypothetical protein
MYALLLSPTHATCQSISVFLFVHPNDIWWGIQSIKLLVIQSTPPPCYLVLLRPKYPFLKHPKPTFVPQYGKKSFTHKQNNRQNFNSVQESQSSHFAVPTILLTSVSESVSLFSDTCAPSRFFRLNIERQLVETMHCGNDEANSTLG